jgi:mannose-6-phosphate isomerase-like protein (cupin superfamily)
MAKQPKAIFGNHPYTEGAKKEVPIFLDSTNIGYFLYPDTGLDYSDLNNVFFSGERLTVCTMDIGPGGFFNPPDYHPGDEAYFVTEGTINQYNPATGQMIEVIAGEALLIPKGALHSAYNFGDSKLRVIAVIAPKIVEDQLFPTDTDRPKKLLQGLNNKTLPKIGEYDDPCLIGSIDHLGSWPAPGPLLREKGVLYHISEQKKLKAVHGDLYPILVKFCVSNDFLQMGEYYVPVGGTTCRHSDVIVHSSECVLVGLDGITTVYLPETRGTYQLHRYEGLFLPKGTKYNLINYEAKRAHCLFAIEGSDF